MKKITFILLFMATVIMNAQTFTEHVLADNLTNATSVFVTDLDGDGDLDIVAVGYNTPGNTDGSLVWYENDGAQTYTQHLIKSPINGALYVATGDADSDGDVDIVVNAYDANTAFAYMNDGSQNFTEIAYDTASTGSNYTSGADFDGDTDLDVVVANYLSNELALHTNNSPGFTKTVVDAAIMGVSSVEVTDIDGDGNDDLLVTATAGNEVVWYKGDGAGAFAAKQSVATLTGASGAYGADMDGDGDMDVIASSQGGNTVVWYESDGATPTPAFTMHAVDAALSWASFAQPVDFDNDGNMDIVASGISPDNKLVWYKSDGATPPTFTANVIAHTANGPYGIRTSDVDGDGDQDIVVAMGTSNNVVWFENKPAPLTNPSSCGLGLAITDNACPTNDSFEVDVTTAAGTQLGTDVILTDVKIVIAHTWDNDLEISLTSPNNVTVLLSSNNGGLGDNYGDPADTTCATVTTFNMTGVDGLITAGTAPFIGSFMPEGNFNDFNDASTPIGLWKIEICDGASGDEGTLEFIELVFATPPACPDVTNLAAGNFATGTSADLTWDAVTEATTGYNWEIQPQGTAQGDGALVEGGTVTTNAAAATALVNDTDYTLYVQADCGVTDGTSVYVSYDFTFHIPLPGESCADPIVVGTLPYTTSDDTANYGDNYNNGDSTCSANYLNGDDVVYSFTPTNTNTYDIVMSNVGATYSGIHVMDACLTGTETCVGFVGNSGTSDRELLGLALTAGTEYFIVISTWATPQSVTYDLAITENSCTNATVTYTAVEDCANAQFTVDVEITDMGTATAITISDDQGSASQPATAAGIFTFGPYPSGTSVLYTVLDDNDASCTQDNTTAFTCPPANDDCANAIPLTIGASVTENPVDGNVSGATVGSETNSCGSNGPGVWYSVMVPSDGIVNIQTGDDSLGGTGFDSVIEAFSGDCTTGLTSIDCDDDGVPGFSDGYSLLELTGLTAGDTIYVRVWEYAGNEVEPFSVSAWNPNAAATNDLQTVGFNYYPNPVSNELTMTANENITTISIYNMLGQEVKTLQPSALEATVDMTNLAAGTYFVKAQVGDAVGTFKVIKK